MGREAVFWCLAMLSFWACAAALLTPNGVNLEVQALMDIKKLLDDPHGVLNWDENAVDPCGWTAVSCSKDNLVITLAISSQHLSGTISPSIGNLTHLRSLRLQDNNVSGQIPPELGRLLELQELDLSDNHLTGEIPSCLSQLKSLQYLRFNNNSLTGDIPMGFANMTRLSFLDLAYNNLSGPVPRVAAKIFNVSGNPMICAIGRESDCNATAQMPVVSSLYDAQGKDLPSRKPVRHDVALALGFSLGFICLVTLGFYFSLRWRNKHCKQIFFDVTEQSDEARLGNLRRFELRELQIATCNFSSKNMIGKGGFGHVYRGYLRDGTAVAVKRLKDSSNISGEIQFQTEVEILSHAIHRNLLKLYGFCITPTERLLVYPYMSNGNVVSCLKAKPSSLDWGARKRIALGTARGLLYLHEQCDPKIIHRDVKAANILLDECYEAILGDFGLAKLLDHRDTHVTTAVCGTVGHIAPEYLSTGQSSEKTDVFGFGILLVELITGKTALEFNKAANQKGSMLDWVKKIDQEKTKLDMLVDKELTNNYEQIELEDMVNVALLCTRCLPSHRPKMSEVVRMLEGDKLEASQMDDITTHGANPLSSSVRDSDLTDDSLMLVQATELSGPR